MGEDRRSGEMSRKKMKMKPIFWICIVLLGIFEGRSAASQDDTFDHRTENPSLAVTEEAMLISSSERTSNAIPEAEEGLKKFVPKKTSSLVANEQLEKPYPYYKSENQAQNHKKASSDAAVPDTDHADDNAHYSKRSGISADVLALNGTLSVSVAESASSPQPESATEPLPESEFESKTETESEAETTTPLSTTSQPTEATTLDDFYSDFSTTPDTITTLLHDNTQYNQDTSSYPDSITVNDELPTSKIGNATAPTLTMTKDSTTPVTMTPTASSITEQQEESSTVNTDMLSTSTEIITTTLEDEPATMTTITDEERATTIIPKIVQPTVTTATPQVSSEMTASMATTVTPASTVREPTSIILATTPKVKLLTTTITTITTWSNAMPSNTMTPRNTAPSSSTTSPTSKELSSTTSVNTLLKATTSSEMQSSVFTWQDESSESTTDFIPRTVPPEDVTLLVKIVFEGTWHDVCSKLPVLRQSLADLVNSSVEKPISPGRIVFHQTQCFGKLSPTSLMSEMPLTSVLVYVVDANGNFDGTLTKVLPRLYEITPIDFPLTIHSFVLVQDAGSGNAIAVVIVSCVAFVCLILLAGLLFIMRKRQGRFNYGERCRPVSLDAYSLDSVSAYNSVRRSKGALRCSKRSYGNPTFEDSSAIPAHPLNFAGLSAFCDDSGAIAEEFASIPQVSSKIDELPAGAELKNRYANVIPLPETRVPLQRLNNDPLTEYINASYVRGPKNASKYYIACQAPTDNTVSDFWRMIWEQQCKVIIMLTDLVENGVEKCTEYIPPLEVSDCHRLYGDFQVTLKKREAKEKYAISTLHLKNLENNTFREVSHIWYLWPASGAPTDAAGLIAVLLEARALQRGAAGPIVVHCSPGTGRTGTLVALDLCIRQYEITRTVDVPRVVYTIRRDRAGAVQTREQYVFIYKALNLYASKLAGGSIEST